MQTPDLSPSIGGDGTADGAALAPDECFLGPGIDNLGRRRMPAGYCVDVLAIAVVGTVREGTRSNQMVGPVLRHLGELIRPDERQYTHPRADRVVSVEDRLRYRCDDRLWAGAAYWPPFSGSRGVYWAGL